jgi:hypothetical protein
MRSSEYQYIKNIFRKHKAREHEISIGPFRLLKSTVSAREAKAKLTYQDSILVRAAPPRDFLHLRRPCPLFAVASYSLPSRHIAAITLPWINTGRNLISGGILHQGVTNSSAVNETFFRKIAYKGDPLLTTSEGIPCNSSQRHKQSLLRTPETLPYITDSALRITGPPFHAPKKHSQTSYST